MSNYDKEVLTASSLLSRLWHIESEIKYMKENIEDLDNSYHDIETNVDNIEEDVEGLDRACSDRLDAIEKRLDSIIHGADVRNHRHYKLEEDYNRQLSKCAVTQATIKAIEEKLNAID